MTTNELSPTKLVLSILQMATRPLTVNEILARVAPIRRIESSNPAAMVRSAIMSEHRAVTLGGRPAHYTWWPRHLADNSFRQALHTSDLAAGTLVLAEDVWYAMWPHFFGGSREKGEAKLYLEGGPVLDTYVRLLPSKAGRGIHAEPALADWLATQGAAQTDDLIVRVLNVDEHCYALSLDRSGNREGIDARNQALADIAEKALRSGRGDTPHFELIPRMIAHGAYRHPLPPDPWQEVLRADLRFVISEFSADLAVRIVASAEREIEIPPDSLFGSRPKGREPWSGKGVEGYDKNTRRAWAAYLFDHGMEHLWAGWTEIAEAYYRLALQLDDKHADAWVHVGNRRFDEGLVAEALAWYERGIDAALERTIGDPERYVGPFWGDLDSRPFMRAIGGKGQCLWRLDRIQEARAVFQDMLRWNPNDNQGIRFMLPDLDEGLSWKEHVAREKARG